MLPVTDSKNCSQKLDHALNMNLTAFLFENPHEDRGRRLNFLTRWYNELGPRRKRSYTSSGESISVRTLEAENTFFFCLS